MGWGVGNDAKHNVAEKRPKKLPAAAAWEPGGGKHNVNFTKSSQSIGKYTEFWHVPKREIQQSTVRVHKMKNMYVKKCMESTGPLTAAWPCLRTPFVEVLLMVQKSGEKTGWYGESTIIYRILYVSEGAGFLLSTVCEQVSGVLYWTSTHVTGCGSRESRFRWVRDIPCCKTGHEPGICLPNDISNCWCLSSPKCLKNHPKYS